MNRACDKTLAASMIRNLAARPFRRRPRSAKVRVPVFAALLIIGGGAASPLLADVAPREALPSREAIGWLLETEATGSMAPWINSRSGYSGTIAITQSWQRPDGTSCRTYTVTAVSGGPRIMLKGTGCRTGAGIWDLTEDAPAVVTALHPSSPGAKPPPPTDETPDDPATAPPGSLPLVVEAPPEEPPPAAAPPDRAPDQAAVAGPPQDDPVPAPAETVRIAVGDDPGAVPGRASAAADPTPGAVEERPAAIAASLPSPSDE